MAKRYFNGEAREVVAGFYCDNIGKVYNIIKGIHDTNTDDAVIYNKICLNVAPNALLFPSHGVNISGDAFNLNSIGSLRTHTVSSTEYSWLGESVKGLSPSNTEFHIYFDCSSIPDNAIITMLEVELDAATRYNINGWSRGYTYATFEIKDLSIDLFTTNDELTMVGTYTSNFRKGKIGLNLTKADLENAYIKVYNPHVIPQYTNNNNRLNLDYAEIKVNYKI